VFCRQCNQDKPLSDFYLVEGKPRSRCKLCICSKTKLWRHKTGRSKFKQGSPRNDLTGKRIGLLTIVEDRGLRGRHRYWLCRCSCGIEKEICHTHLASGNQKSCGCLHRRSGSNNPLWGGHGEISGLAWDQIKRKRNTRSSAIDREFSITIEYAWRLFIKQNRKCALTGLPLEFGIHRSASLDRIDNAKGYIPGNVQWVHKDVNRMKNVFSQGRFIQICQLVASNNEATIRITR
jgi:hypothetical protein